MRQTLVAQYLRGLARTMPSIQIADRTLSLIAGGALAGYAAASMTGALDNRIRLCPIYRLLGVECPLCGLTRLLSLMPRRGLKLAVAAQPRAVLAVVGFSLLIIIHLYKEHRERSDIWLPPYR
jgi:hypothetical protein